MSALDVARILHNAVCHGFSSGYCEGDEHTKRTQMSTARKFLNAEDDDAAVRMIHDKTCDVMLDPNLSCDENRHLHAMLLAPRVQDLLALRHATGDAA